MTTITPADYLSNMAFRISRLQRWSTCIFGELSVTYPCCVPVGAVHNTAQDMCQY